jgi:hypothetical protein
MKTKSITGYELRDGMTVLVQGHPMTISEITIAKAYWNPIEGKEVVRFTGHCTDDKDNDSIRHTSYNGGRYGQLASMTYALIVK